MPMNPLLVGLGGALGSIARYLASGWAQAAAKNGLFPYGTLAVNLLGCLVIGFLAQLSESRGVFIPEARALVFVGILGGFTTFSTFGNETLIAPHVSAGLVTMEKARVKVYRFDKR